MNITLFNQSFRFSINGLILYLSLVSILCTLGFWQLDRSHQKQQLLDQQQSAADAPPLDLEQQTITNLDTVRYHQIKVQGHYDEARQFLIDNQTLDGKPGYFVLTPFRIDNSTRTVLVNRGWVPLGNDRKTLPDVHIEQTVTGITGRINYFPGVGVILKGAEIPTDTWPSVVQVVKHDILSAKLAEDLYNFQIELNPEEPAGYQRQWKINVAITPEKHVGYAVQWFGLAITLTGLFFWISKKKPQ